MGRPYRRARPYVTADARLRDVVLDVDATVTELKLDVPNNDFWFWEPRFLRPR